MKNKSKFKILIANSIGKDMFGNNYILFPSRWTASVGKSKSFDFYPYELAYLSSLLKNEGKFDVKMIDGNFERLNWKEYFNKYKNEKPNFLVMETSTVVYQDDLKFALSFKKKFGTKLIFCGQHATAFPKEVLKDGIDYVCLGEFEMTVLDIVKGLKSKEILGLYPNKRRELLDIDKLPFPEDEDISRINYSNIGGCDYKEIEFFASRGCMMNCVFCVARQTYYNKPNFRPRDVSNIIEEIKYLRKKYPEVEGIFFDEENHNTNKKFILELCRAIVDNGLSDLKYDAMCGYWTLDKEMLRAMKKAGYYKIRIGIESASEEACRGMKKNINVEKMLEVLNWAKEEKIRMYGTFTFGVPGSNPAEDKKTLVFIKKLLDEDLLYDFQTSVCTPQPGTPFFDYLDKGGFLLTKDWKQYNGGTAVYEYPNYKKEEIEKNVSEAFILSVKNAIKNKGFIKTISDEIRLNGIKSTMVKSMNLGKSIVSSI
jgi:radical SAM superfamily enzyme YgiQ (UPF0313 family)